MSDENQNLDENNVFNDFMKEDEENEANTTADANAVLAATEAAAAAAAAVEEVENDAAKSSQKQEGNNEVKEDDISSAVEAAAAAIASSNRENKVSEHKQQSGEHYKKLDFEKNEDLINVLGDKNSIEASTEAIIEMNGGAGKKRKAEALGQLKDNSNKKRRKRKVLSCLRCRKDKQACSRTFPCSRCIKKEFVCKFVDNITGEEFFPQPQDAVQEAVGDEKIESTDAEVATAIIATVQPTEEDNLLNIDEGLSEAKEHKVEDDQEGARKQHDEESTEGSNDKGEEDENIMSVIDTDLKDE